MTSTSIDIDLPPGQVFAYVTDATRFAEWQNGVVDGHAQNTAGMAVGDRCVNTRRVGFSKRPVTSEITEVDPPRTWAVRGIDGPIRAEVKVTVEPLQDGTRSKLTIAIDFSGHGIAKVLVPLLVRPRAGREMETNMERLKRRLETGS